MPQLFTEFGRGPTDDFRDEGTPEAVQGLAATFIYGDPADTVDSARLSEFINDLRGDGIHNLLVFANSDDIALIGTFLSVTRNGSVRCMPQLLPDLAYSLLTATVVYLEFRDAIRWKITNYL